MLFLLMVRVSLLKFGTIGGPLSVLNVMCLVIECQDVATSGTNVGSGQLGNKANVWVVKDNGHGPSTVVDRKDNADSSPVPSLKLLTPISTPCVVMSPSGGRGGVVEEVCNDVLVDSPVEFVVTSSSTNVHNPVQCSLNKFSVLEAVVVVEGGDSFLPYEAKFVAGLSQVDIPPIAPIKRKNKGRGKGNGLGKSVEVPVQSGGTQGKGGGSKKPPSK